MHRGTRLWREAVLYNARERRHFWKSLPSKWVMIASVADIAIISLLAICGLMLTALPAADVGTVLGAAAVFAVLLDQIKRRSFVDSGSRPQARRAPDKRRRRADPPRRNPVGWRARLGLGELAQHEVQDAAVAVVLDLGGRIDTQAHGELLVVAVGSGDLEDDPRDDLAIVEGGKSADRIDLRAVEAVTLGAFARQELEGEDAHPDEVRAVNALEAFDEDGLDAEELVPLAAQSRDEPVPYSLPPIMMSGVPSVA